MFQTNYWPFRWDHLSCFDTNEQLDRRMPSQKSRHDFFSFPSSKDHSHGDFSEIMMNVGIKSQSCEFWKGSLKFRDCDHGVAAFRVKLFQNNKQISIIQFHR